MAHSLIKSAKGINGKPTVSLFGIKGKVTGVLMLITQINDKIFQFLIWTSLDV